MTSGNGQPPDWVTQIDNLSTLHDLPPGDQTQFAWSMPDSSVLLRACNAFLSQLPFIPGLQALVTQSQSVLVDFVGGISKLLGDLGTAVADFINAFDNLNWNDPLTIIPTLLRDAITACWNLFWALLKWCIEVIDVLTNLDIFKGLQFLTDLGDYLDLPELKTAFNTLLTTWESLDFAGDPLHALPAAFIAFVTFLQAVIHWFWDVVEKLLGLVLPGWFKWSELGAVWTQYRQSLQAINWSDIPGALLLFTEASITALQGVGRWILDVFTGLIGSSASVIHTMFAGPIAFLNQMILQFFGQSGLDAWQAALNWLAGTLGATPIAALNRAYDRIQTLESLFVDLMSGNIVTALTGFFNNFVNNWAFLPPTLQSDMTALFAQIGDMGQQVLDTLHNFFTGGNNTGNPISSLVSAIQTWGSTILGNVMGPVMSAIGNLSISNIVADIQNLLLNPGFSSAISISDPSSTWTWDDTVFLSGLGVAAPGSAQVTASGVLKALRSNTISVSPGKTLQVAINVLADGLVSTGSLSLQLITEAGTTTIDTMVAPSGAPTGWVGASPTAKAGVLSGTYTVPASGVQTVTQRLVVTEGAVAGTVWFDGAQLNTTGNLPNTLVQGLSGVGATIGQDLQNTWDTISGALPNLGDLNQIGQRLQNLLPNTGLFDATQLHGQVPSAGVAGIAGIGDMGAALQQTWDHITGAAPNAGTLGQIGTRLQNLTSGGTFDATKLFNQVPSTNVSGIGGQTDLGTALQRTWDFMTTGIAGDGTYAKIQTKLSNLTAAGNMNNTAVTGVLGASSLGAAVTNTVDAAWQAITGGSNTGITLPQYQTALNNIPGTNVTGSGGAATNTATHQNLWDTIYNAINPGPNITGVSINQVGNALQQLRTDVNNAGAMAQTSSGKYLPVTTTLTGSGTYTTPSWLATGDFVDIIVCGAGGGGAGGGASNTGNTGGAGSWNAVTLTKGTQFTTTSFTVTVGAGGAKGGAPNGSGSAGGASSVAVTGYGTLTANGGAGGVGVGGTQVGASPGNYTYTANSVTTTYTGGAVENVGNANGNAPGGAGAGGNSGLQIFSGGQGAPGQVWIKAYQH